MALREEECEEMIEVARNHGVKLSTGCPSKKRTWRRWRARGEMTGAVLRFPGERLASFTCSF